MTFGERRFQQTINSHKEVLDKFYAGFNNAKELKGTSHIFLDTNVLLRIYSTSFKARGKLLDFFKNYKSRIVLTSQVQWEYVKNRENVITKFSKDVTQTIPENFRNTILDAITKFSNDNKIILTDYDIILKEIESLHIQAEKLLDVISKEVKNENVSSERILYRDEFISIFQELELLKPLEEGYLKKIKKEYEDFLPTINKSEQDKETFKTFPGCFEGNDKSDDPYGDYIIYHEMLEYAKKHTTDIIFLTYDVTKGDWMQKSKSPHLHYVENFYQNTGRLIYILDGQRTFDELLDINFKLLIKSPSVTTDIEVTNLQVFLDNYEPMNNIKTRLMNQSFVDELYKNKVLTLEDLEEKLNSVKEFIPTIKDSHSGFTRLGTMRGCLTLLNPNYIVNNRKFIEISPKMKETRLNWLSTII